jgi:hypothetical protein
LCTHSCAVGNICMRHVQTCVTRQLAKFALGRWPARAAARGQLRTGKMARPSSH